MVIACQALRGALSLLAASLKCLRRLVAELIRSEYYRNKTNAPPGSTCRKHHGSFPAQHILIHKSDWCELMTMKLLPLLREGGSRSTFDKLRAGETEGFSAEPKRFYCLGLNNCENPSVSADRAPKGHFTTSPWLGRSFTYRINNLN